jgi:hypothetical protein
VQLHDGARDRPGIGNAAAESGKQAPAAPAKERRHLHKPMAAATGPSAATVSSSSSSSCFMLTVKMIDKSSAVQVSIPPASTVRDLRDLLARQGVRASVLALAGKSLLPGDLDQSLQQAGVRAGGPAVVCAGARAPAAATAPRKVRPQEPAHVDWWWLDDQGSEDSSDWLLKPYDRETSALLETGFADGQASATFYREHPVLRMVLGPMVHRTSVYDVDLKGMWQTNRLTRFRREILRGTLSVRWEWRAHSATSDARGGLWTAHSPAVSLVLERAFTSFTEHGPSDSGRNDTVFLGGALRWEANFTEMRQNNTRFTGDDWFGSQAKSLRRVDNLSGRVLTVVTTENGAASTAPPPASPALTTGQQPSSDGDATNKRKRGEEQQPSSSPGAPSVAESSATSASEEPQPQERSPPPRVAELSAVLAPENHRAIEFIASSCLDTNGRDRAAVMERLRCSASELDRIVGFMLGCPKIIHFQPENVLELFVRDSNYRNQFEVHSSEGLLDERVRAEWESSLFGGSSYQRHTRAERRPKYGVVNYSNDPLGDAIARHQYGAAYLVLKNVEDRVTYCWGDSAFTARDSTIGGRTVLASGIWMARILNAMRPEDLQCLRSLACGEPTIAAGSSSSSSSSSHRHRHRHRRLSTYLEFHVHGPVRFVEDVVAVCLPKRFQHSGNTLPAGWSTGVYENSVPAGRIYYENRHDSKGPQSSRLSGQKPPAGGGVPVAALAQEFGHKFGCEVRWV